MWRFLRGRAARVCLCPQRRRRPRGGGGRRRGRGGARGGGRRGVLRPVQRRVLQPQRPTQRPAQRPVEQAQRGQRQLRQLVRGHRVQALLEQADLLVRVVIAEQFPREVLAGVGVWRGL